MRLVKQGLLEHLEAMNSRRRRRNRVNLEIQRHEGLRDSDNHDQHKSLVNGAHGEDNGRSLGHNEKFPATKYAQSRVVAKATT